MNRRQAERNKREVFLDVLRMEDGTWTADRDRWLEEGSRFAEANWGGGENGIWEQVDRMRIMWVKWR